MIRALALALAAAPAAADVTLGAATKVVQGVHCRTEPVGSRTAEDTIAGSIDTYDARPEFRWLTDTVPAALGVSFGLHVTVPAEMAGTIRYEVTHPPMGPEGVTVESWLSSIGTEPTYVGFHFENDYELEPGPWIMRGYSGDTLLYEAHFTVVAAELVPEITGGCFGPDLFS